VAQDAYVHGVSTRSVDALVKTMGSPAIPVTFGTENGVQKKTNRIDGVSRFGSASTEARGVVVIAGYKQTYYGVAQQKQI
jgi:hypothetical protein